MARKTWAALLAQFADNDVGAIDAVHIRDLVDSLSAHAEARPPEHTDNQTSGFDVGHTWIDTSASPWPQAWRCVASDTVTGIWARIEGPPGTPGGPGLIPMGIWDDEATYPPTALVRHGPALWVANAVNTNLEPGVEPEWDLFLEDGEPGPPGEVDLSAQAKLWAEIGGLVMHGSDANVERPDVGDRPLRWDGSVQPGNMADGDSWLDTEDYD